MYVCDSIVHLLFKLCLNTSYSAVHFSLKLWINYIQRTISGIRFSYGSNENCAAEWLVLVLTVQQEYNQGGERFRNRTDSGVAHNRYPTTLYLWSAPSFASWFKGLDLYYISQSCCIDNAQACSLKVATRAFASVLRRTERGCPIARAAGP